jgi:flagellar basal body-associated protein FliL
VNDANMFAEAGPKRGKGVVRILVIVGLVVAAGVGVVSYMQRGDAQRAMGQASPAAVAKPSSTSSQVPARAAAQQEQNALDSLDRPATVSAEQCRELVRIGA